jgi:MoaA/NifB/PqqE/SkfB family radical SAM enzyme
MEGKLPKLDLNVTNRCNFRCTHCAFDSGLIVMPELSLSELEKILRETKELGGNKIDITGGEPTLRKDIFDIVKLAKSMNYKIELVTNGSNLDKESLIKLRELGLDSTAISLDGSNYETYARIRRTTPEIYQKVLRTIDLSLGFFPTKINTVVFESNLEDIPNITKWCIGKRVYEHGLYYFTPIGRGERNKEKAVEPLKWLDFIRSKLVPLINEGTKISLELPLIEKEHFKEEYGCIANTDKSHLQILPNGNTFPCAILASYSLLVANLREGSIKGIWQNPELWNEYWKRINQKFQGNGGYCVDFKGAFQMTDYDLSRYAFVCPLRKFNLREVPK